MSERERRLHAAVDRLTNLVNPPLDDGFTAPVKLEPAHQVERWG